MSKENINKKKYVVFEMVKILKEHTDRLHPMKQKELVERLHEAGYTTDRSTVRRTMTDLIQDESSRVRSAANTIHDEKDCLNDTYYSGLYYEQDFSPAELRWLIDGILFSRNVPHDRRDELIGKLMSGQNIALISDAGTPGISDPGEVLVAKCIEMDTVLEQLDIKEYKKVCDLFDDDIYNAVNLINCLNGRKVAGGPAPQQVKQQMDVISKILMEY